MATAPELSPREQDAASMMASFGRRPAVSHTHRPLEEILRELQVGPIERLLLWLSKTDIYVLSLSPQSNRMTLASLGMMVVFTTVLAFASGVYACQSMLIAPDSAWQWPVSLVLGLLYAFGIMIIDREIVGAASLKSLPIRFVFAIGIATAVSYPVKLKFFEGRIDAEITKIYEERNRDKISRLEELKLTGESERQQQREAVKGRFATLDREIAVLDGEIKREASDVRCDVRCQGFRQQKERLLQQRGAAEKALEDLKMRAPPPPYVQREVETLQSTLDKEKKLLYDFLSKWEALGRIKADPKIDYEVLSWFVFAFFMLLELVPLALKLSLGKTEYNYYIEARSNLNKQKIIAFNNFFIEAMRRDPMNAARMPREITDLIAQQMEDEPLASVNAAGDQEWSDWMRRNGQIAMGQTAAPVASVAAGPQSPARSPPPNQSSPASPPRGAITVDEPPPPHAA